MLLLINRVKKSFDRYIATMFSSAAPRPVREFKATPTVWKKQLREQCVNRIKQRREILLEQARSEREGHGTGASLHDILMAELTSVNSNNDHQNKHGGQRSGGGHGQRSDAKNEMDCDDEFTLPVINDFQVNQMDRGVMDLTEEEQLEILIAMEEELYQEMVCLSLPHHSIIPIPRFLSVLFHSLIFFSNLFIYKCVISSKVKSMCLS